MATQKKILELIAGIKTVYSYYAKDSDVKVLVKLWGASLKNFPDEIVDTAFLVCLQNCKMPPTPADVIEQIKTLIKANEPTDVELWDIYIKALNETDKYVYRMRYPLLGEDPHQKIGEIWQELPEKLRQYIGSKGELMRRSTCTDNDLKYERAKFSEKLADIDKRTEYKALNSTYKITKNITKTTDKFVFI